MHNISAFEVFVLKPTFDTRLAEIDGVQPTFHPVCIPLICQNECKCLYLPFSLSLFQYSCKIFQKNVKMVLMVKWNFKRGQKSWN